MNPPAHYANRADPLYICEGWGDEPPSALCKQSWYSLLRNVIDPTPSSVNISNRVWLYYLPLNANIEFSYHECFVLLGHGSWHITIDLKRPVGRAKPITTTKLIPWPIIWLVHVICFAAIIDCVISFACAKTFCHATGLSKNRLWKLTIFWISL